MCNLGSSVILGAALLELFMPGEIDEGDDAAVVGVVISVSSVCPRSPPPQSSPTPPTPWPPSLSVKKACDLDDAALHFVAVVCLRRSPSPTSPSSSSGVATRLASATAKTSTMPDADDGVRCFRTSSSAGAPATPTFIFCFVIFPSADLSRSNTRSL